MVCRGRGIVLLDDSPRNMDFGIPVVDSSFPTGTVTFALDKMRQWLQAQTDFDSSIALPTNAHNASIEQMTERWQPYFRLNKVLLDQFHAGDEPSRRNITGAFTQTRSGLRKWMQQLGPSNGKAISLLMGSSMLQDLTGVHEQIRRARLPFLVYSNGNSAGPRRAIKWNARQMSSCKEEEQQKISFQNGSLTSYCSSCTQIFLQFDGSAGTHCPFLNEDSSQATFFDVVTKFLARLRPQPHSNILYS